MSAYQFDETTPNVAKPYFPAQPIYRLLASRGLPQFLFLRPTGLAMSRWGFEFGKPVERSQVSTARIAAAVVGGEGGVVSSCPVFLSDIVPQNPVSSALSPPVSSRPVPSRPTPSRHSRLVPRGPISPGPVPFSSRSSRPL